MIKINELIEKLNLVPLENEGGLWSSLYRSKEKIPSNILIERNNEHDLGSTIYYLLTMNSFSSMHKLLSDEVWFYHLGPSLEMLFVYPDGHSEIKILGPNILEGEQPQIVVPRNVYQGARMKDKGDFTLVSTANFPGYELEDFQIGTYEELKPLLSSSDHEKLLIQLTGKIKYR